MEKCPNGNNKNTHRFIFFSRADAKLEQHTRVCCFSNIAILNSSSRIFHSIKSIFQRYNGYLNFYSLFRSKMEFEEIFVQKYHCNCIGICGKIPIKSLVVVNSQSYFIGEMLFQSNITR